MQDTSSISWGTSLAHSAHSPAELQCSAWPVCVPMIVSVLLVLVVSTDESPLEPVLAPPIF